MSGYRKVLVEVGLETCGWKGASFYVKALSGFREGSGFGFRPGKRHGAAMRRIGIVAVAVLGLPLAVFAQRAGGVGGGAGVHISAPVAAARVSAPVAAHPVSHVAVATHPAAGHVRTSSPNRIVSLNPNFGNSTFVSNNVPGLGFDYPHLAAVSPKNGQVGRNFRFRQTVPFGFGGFLISTPEIYVDNPQAVAEAQETAAENGDADAQAQFEAAQMQAYRAGQQSVAPHAAPPEPAPEPAADPASYVFVMRNGGVVFAVAYSWDNGTLRYVTPEGQRKSVAADSLDMDATTQFNESRGLSFRVGA